MDMREIIQILEDSADIERTADKAIANLMSYESQVYTKLAQKVKRIEELSDEMKTLKEEVKSETRQYVADLFDAEDVARTRVVNTISFIFTLSKDPKPTETVQYAKVIAELEKSLTPELIVVLNNLKEQFKSVTQKEPSLKIAPQELDEGITDKFKNYFAKFKNFINSWASKYDSKLDSLKQQVK